MEPHRITRSALTSRWLMGLGWRARWRIVLFAFPALMSVAAAGFWAEAALYNLRSVPVTGTVVQLYEWPGETVFDRGKTNYEPVFTYEANGGSYRASVGSAHASYNVPVGETATIRVIPGARGNVRMETFVGLWGLPAVLTVIALGAFAVALPLWLLLDRLIWKRDRT